MAEILCKYRAANQPSNQLYRDDSTRLTYKIKCKKSTAIKISHSRKLFFSV